MDKEITVRKSFFRHNSVMLVIILLLSVISYLGGLILPLGLVILTITIPVGFILSVIGIYFCIKYKKINIIAFTLIFVFSGSLVGFFQDYYRTEEIFIQKAGQVFCGHRSLDCSRQHGRRPGGIHGYYRYYTE